MGMIGTYVMVDPETIESIEAGELDVDDVIYLDDESEDVLDVDKAWQIIHYALTGEIDEGDGTDPLRNVMVMDGETLSEDYDGFILPPAYLSQSDVMETNDALQVVSEDEFTRRFRQAEWSDDIYQAPTRGDIDETLEYALDHFRNIKEFFGRAVRDNRCIVFYVN